MLRCFRTKEQHVVIAKYSGLRIVAELAARLERFEASKVDDLVLLAGRDRVDRFEHRLGVLKPVHWVSCKRLRKDGVEGALERILTPRCPLVHLIDSRWAGAIQEQIAGRTEQEDISPSVRRGLGCSANVLGKV